MYMYLQNQTFNIPQYTCFLFTLACFINQSTAGEYKFTDGQTQPDSPLLLPLLSHYYTVYINYKNQHSINIQFLMHCMCELRITQFVHGSHFIRQLLLVTSHCRFTPDMLALFLLPSHLHFNRPGSSVGIATGYGLDSLGIESRWGWNFPHLSRPAHPASCTMGTGYFLGLKSGQGVTLTPHPPSSTMVMKE
jgi:hypothetical protein